MTMTLYQTLEDRGSAEVVERDGPFICRMKSAWLGKGYYFWDTDIKLAHWWGKQSLKNNYIICEAKAIKDNTLWDLQDPSHLANFRDLVHEMIELEVANEDEVLVSHVINFYIERKAFPYQAIRAVAHESFGKEFYRWIGKTIVKFHERRIAFLDLHPLIQVCLMKKTALSLNNYRVIYPEHYCEEILA